MNLSWCHEYQINASTIYRTRNTFAPRSDFHSSFGLQFIYDGLQLNYERFHILLWTLRSLVFWLKFFWGLVKDCSNMICWWWCRWCEANSMLHTPSTIIKRKQTNAQYLLAFQSEHHVMNFAIFIFIIFNFLPKLTIFPFIVFHFLLLAFGNVSIFQRK